MVQTLELSLAEILGHLILKSLSNYHCSYLSGNANFLLYLSTLVLNEKDIFEGWHGETK